MSKNPDQAKIKEANGILKEIEKKRKKIPKKNVFDEFLSQSKGKKNLYESYEIDLSLWKHIKTSQ